MVGRLAVYAEGELALWAPPHVVLPLDDGRTLADCPRAERHVRHRLEARLQQLRVVEVEQGRGDQRADLGLGGLLTE